MQKTECSSCNNAISINESIKVDGKVFCDTCLNSNFPDQKNLKNSLVEKDFDPTICSSCGKDFEDFILNKIARFPVCVECETKIKNRTFPNWVKGFFFGIMLIIIFSFFWNWKYYQAYNDINNASDYFIKGDYTKAAGLMKSASEKVPEVEDIKTLTSYFNGVDLLTKDKSSEALIEFNNCKDKIPEDYNINKLIINAKAGSSFDHKDYQGFLSASKENLAIDSTSADSWTAVASAYACLYAEKGNNEAKLEAYKYIKKGKSIDSTSKEMKIYYNMIDYRIHTRQIITREDFIKKFPKGWTKN